VKPTDFINTFAWKQNDSVNVVGKWANGNDITHVLKINAGPIDRVLHLAHIGMSNGFVGLDGKRRIKIIKVSKASENALTMQKVSE
jgi:hypothetical protein